MKTAPMFCAPNKTSEQHEKEREAADEMEATSDGQRMRSPDEATVKAADSYHRALNRQEREEIYVRITEKGRKKFRAAEMARAQQLIAEKKAKILEKLRAADDDEPTMFQNICVPLGLTVEAAMLMIFEINNFVIDFQDAPEDKPFISLFFNGDTGEIWCELYEPERAR